MKRIFYSFLFVHLLHFGVNAQCFHVKLKTISDSISYAAGVESARGMVKEDVKFEDLDKKLLVKGFESNLSAISVDDCTESIEKFLGPQAQDFNKDYLKEGSECIGRMSGYYFYMQMDQFEQLPNLDLDLVKKGFKQGAYNKYKRHLSDKECAEVLDRFGRMLEEDFLSDIEEKDEIFWTEILNKSGVEQIDETGVYFETIEKGTGRKPTMSSDIEAHYILTNTVGDTLESSYAAGASLKINLGSVIEGWREGFPSLEKGGKYYLYIPYEKAYKNGNAQAPQGALCFYIDFIDFGEKGSLTKSRGSIQKLH